MPDDEERAKDPAFEAVEEAGGGVAEGFEQSEAELVDHAENPDEGGGNSNPERHEIVEDEEVRRVSSDSSEGDHEHSSETEGDHNG